MDAQVLIYRRFQLLGAAVRAAPDLLFGNRGEPPFDLVDPGYAHGCDVQVKAASQPANRESSPSYKCRSCPAPD